jgi:hypothetical protein
MNFVPAKSQSEISFKNRYITLDMQNAEEYYVFWGEEVSKQG